MKAIQYLSHQSQETMALGKKFAALLQAGDILCLFGDLGSGKTTFVKGLAQGLKIDPTQVHSPTFILMNAYEGRLPLFHFDLYRLDHSEEILQLGYEEYFYDQGVAVIEWADRLKTLLPEDHVAIHLQHKTEAQRLIQISAQGPRSCQLLAKIKV